MLRLLTRFSGKEWLMIIIAVGFIVLGVWIDLKAPEFVGAITKAISPDQNDPTKVAGTMNDIWINGAWMLLCAVGSVITIVIVGYITAVISASFSTRIRQDLFEKVGTFGTHEMKKFSIASLITRSTNDVTNVRMFVAMGMQFIIKAPVTAIWAVLKITNSSLELSFVTAVAVVALMVVVVFLIFLVLPRFRKIQLLTDKLNQVSRENLTGIRVVRAYNAEAYEELKFETANDNLTKNNLFTYRAFGLLQPFMSLLMSGLGLALWWTTAVLLNSGKMAPSFLPSVMEFNQYAFQIVFAFMMLIMVFTILPRVTISARRINEVMRMNPSIIDGEMVAVKEQQKSKQGEIEFNNVSFKYPDAEACILKDVNLKIKKGQTVAFIGSTGSGKSTLINLVPRLYDATDGEVLLDGVNVRDYTLEQLRDKVGYIPQTATLFQGTIASNVAFGTVNGKEIDDGEIKRALEIAQASDLNINREVSQSGKNLSGGQKQRVAIARVVARRPEVFIFDDTFSALDYKTDKALRGALKKECSGSTVLIVAQRIGTIKDADMIVVLDTGCVVGKGTHKELMKNCDVYKAIAYSQLSKEELL